MNLHCAEFEILLCDAVDGTLRGDLRVSFDAHLESCGACAAMAADVLGAAAFMERAAAVEPPKELLTRILLKTGPAHAGQTSSTNGFAWWKRLLRPALQPRLAMGMAMTILSVSMLAQVFGLEVRQLRPSDLEPARIWAGVEDGAHRQWSRVVKYYENIRVVYEIQSRLKEWADQEEHERQSAPQQQKSTPPGR